MRWITYLCANYLKVQVPNEEMENKQTQSCATVDLTSSGEIEELEQQLKRRKDHWEEINQRYKLLVKMITKWIEDEHFN